jgi:hypothetical protein
MMGTGLSHFHVACIIFSCCLPRSLADQTRCFISSVDQPELVFRQTHTQQIVFQAELFEQLQQAAQS